MLGTVEHEELPALIAAAFAVGFLSVSDGFGLAAIEILAAGVPLVARYLPVLREVLGGAALLVEGPGSAASALRRVLEEPAAEREQRAALGREQAGRCSWASAAAAHLAWYASR